MPSAIFEEQEKLLNSPEIDLVCQSVSHHGNNRLSAEEVHVVFTKHTEGLSNRRIAALHNIGETAIRNYLKKFRAWMEIL